MPRPDLGGGDDVADWLAPRHGVGPAIAAGAWDMMLVGEPIAIRSRRVGDGAATTVWIAVFGRSFARTT